MARRTVQLVPPAARAHALTTPAPDPHRRQLIPHTRKEPATMKKRLIFKWTNPGYISLWFGLYGFSKFTLPNYGEYKIGLFMIKIHR
jgi:hypothetical protein